MFRIGDKVRLRSGGPAMTIMGYVDDISMMVHVSWFPHPVTTTTAGPMTAKFPDRALEHVIKSKPQLRIPKLVTD